MSTSIQSGFQRCRASSVSVADRSFATIALLAYSIVERTFTKFRVEALRKYPSLSGVHTRVLAAEQPYPRLHDK
jgi:hypothetical protein